MAIQKVNFIGALRFVDRNDGRPRRILQQRVDTLTFHIFEFAHSKIENGNWEDVPQNEGEQA